MLTMQIWMHDEHGKEEAVEDCRWTMGQVR